MRSRLLCRDLAVAEEQRGARLGLGRGGDVALDRQVSQEVPDLVGAEFLGVALAVEVDRPDVLQQAVPASAAAHVER
jgi:hypothetical protein